MQPATFYCSYDGEQTITSVDSLVQQLNIDREASQKVVCVIENISPAWIDSISQGLGLDRSFFADFAQTQPKQGFWKRRSLWTWKPPPSGTEMNANYAIDMESICLHVNGMFEYHGLKRKSKVALTVEPNFANRDCFEDSPWPIQSNTRLSYYRISETIYLFLVDAPLKLKGCAKGDDTRARTSLRFTVATNRGGLLLPQLFAQPNYSLLEVFKNVFQHLWHFSFLFPSAASVDGAIPHHALLYMLVSSTWESNLRFLDARIKRISFQDLRDPNDLTNNDLHDCREDLAALRAAIIETLDWVPENLSEYFDLWRSTDKSSLRHPIRNMERILKDADILQSFLMETFQLLMSSISVRDSKISVEQAQLSNKQAILSGEQAQRSAWLTQLATLYLPLSVLTGIFGMNLKEINDSHVPFWWSLVVLAILVVCTGIIFFGLQAFQGRKHRKAPSTVESEETGEMIAVSPKSAV